MKNKRRNIVSTSPIVSLGTEIPRPMTTIDDYIEKVFRKPLSKSLSSSSSSCSCKFELAPPSSSSLSSSSISSAPAPKSTLKAPPSSSTESKEESRYSECEGIYSSDDTSTERWIIHRLRKKNTHRYVVATRYSLLEKSRAFSLPIAVSLLL
jgi:hypothetical protein